MAIELFTGKPGAGKTHHAVQRALEAIAKGRPVYVCNMNGMEIPGAIPYEDPRKWMDLPPGALLIVDEAQRFWRASRSLDVPPELQEAETHRHTGIDMLLTTQQPTYLLKHLRGLIMPHTHHERLTKGTTRTFRWANRCVDDPESQSERELSEEGVHVLSKAEFSVYKSTELDTHKPKIPKKLIFVIAVGAVVVGMLWWVNHRVSNLAKPADGTQEIEGASAQPIRPQLTGPRKAPLSVHEYDQQHRPRHAAQPWSAPVFDERKAVSKPEVYCITSGAGIDAQGERRAPSHTCLTEQGTVVEMTAQAAADLVKRGGIYNPYREPPQQDRGQQRDEGAGRSPALTGRTAPASPSGASAAFGSVAGYGGIAVGDSAPSANPL